MSQFTINPFIHIDEPQTRRGTLVEVHISDTHFGVIDPKVQYDILTEQFINKINKIHFDILSVDGDLFDHKFLANSDSVRYAMQFVDDLAALCRYYDATLVLLHGTESHDANQLKLFYHYREDPTLDIRIVETACFQYIKGAKVLCLPEEYGKGKMYYRNLLYFSGLYDTVFMHGNLKGAIYGADEEDLDAIRNPTFSIESFSQCLGPIIAGHVHVAGCYDKYMYYNGSPYRWTFGEEKPKGFMVILHNLDTQEHYAHFEEITSFRYDTINLDEMVDKDPKEVIAYISELQKQGIDNIRVEFTLGDPQWLDIIQQYYKNNGSVKIKADIAAVKEQAKKTAEFEEKYQKYNYILDSNLTPYDILTRYINEAKGCVYITVDELKEILSDMEG